MCVTLARFVARAPAKKFAKQRWLSQLLVASDTSAQAHDIESEIEFRIGKLELLAEQRVDPARHRWKRQTGLLWDWRARLTSSQLVRVLGGLTRSSFSSINPFSEQFCDYSVERLTVSLDGLGADDLSRMSLIVSKGYLSARNLQNDVGRITSLRIAEELFWESLAPHALNVTHEAIRSGQTVARESELALAIALAWRQASPQRSEPLLQPLSSAIERVFGARWSALDLARRAEIVCAAGLLHERGAELPQCNGVPLQMRVLRALDPDGFSSSPVMALLLLDVGLSGLGLRKSRIAADVVGALEGTFASASLSLHDVCDCLLLLWMLGRLRLGEPYVFELISRAANAQDQLQQGQRAVLQLVARELTSNLSLSPARGSEEAAVLRLVQDGWFSRPHRSQVSWHKSR